MRVKDFNTDGFTVTTAEHTIIFKPKGECGMGGPTWGCLIVAGVITLEWAYPAFVINYHEGVAAFVGRIGDGYCYVHVLWFRSNNAVSDYRISFSNSGAIYWPTSVCRDLVIVEELGMEHKIPIRNPTI